MAGYNLNHDVMKGQVCSQVRTVYGLQGKPGRRMEEKQT